MVAVVLAGALTVIPPMAAPTLTHARNATYVGVFDTPITLVNGRFTGPPPSAGAPVRRSAGLAGSRLATGDLNRDGRPEAVVVLWSDESGRDRRYFLAVLTADERGVRNVATAPIGDRLQVMAVRIEENRIVVETLTHTRTDPPCCPSQKARRLWAFADGMLMEAESIAR